MSSGLLEAVRPPFCHVPDYDWTAGREVADLARLAGFGPDPEQELVLDAIFAQKSGRSAAFEVAVIASRQNIKTGIFKQTALGWLFITGERLVVWSAHEFRTAQEAFRDLDELVTGSDYLRREVKAVYRGNGDEAIELMSGARLIFKTRTKGGGRGLSGRKVILDEGFALQPMHMGALLPTLSAQPDPQVVYGSSAGLPESDVLRGIRDRGRPGDPRLAYFEWCAPPPSEACAAGDGCTHALTIPGCGCDNQDLWPLANPAIRRPIPGKRELTLSYIEAERRAMPPAEFGRERMGWWDDPAGGEMPISMVAWQACADPRSVMTGRVAIAAAVAPDASSSAIAIAGRRVDGLAHGELAEPPRQGTDGLVTRLCELSERWDPCVLVINPSGAAGALEAELLERGFGPWKRVVDLPTGRWTEVNVNARPLLATSVREYAQACGALAQDVMNGRWRHLGQWPLDVAVSGARTRPLTDAWAWSWKLSAADIAPLEAVTLARHGYATFGVKAPPPPDVY